MPRKLLLLVLLALAAPAAVLASGCGDEAAGVDVAEAAQATGERGTARIDLDVRLSGFGLPGALEVDGEGVTALDEPRMDVTLDLGDVASAFGLPIDDADVRLKVDGADVYVRPPRIPGLELPGGATWAALDLRRAVEALGVETDGLGALFSVDPAAQLRALRAAKGLKEVGEEEIDGATTTHLRGTMTTEDLLAALPAAERDKARRALRELAGTDKAITDPMPVELWVDDDGIVRRMVQEGRIPGQQGVPGGKMRIGYELSDFGARLDTSAPPRDEIYEATKPLIDLLRQGAAAGGVPGTQTD